MDFKSRIILPFLFKSQYIRYIIKAITYHAPKPRRTTPKKERGKLPFSSSGNSTRISCSQSLFAGPKGPAYMLNTKIIS
jgi:hypothetical protein